jgi:hypothetical protein
MPIGDSRGRGDGISKLLISACEITAGSRTAVSGALKRAVPGTNRGTELRMGRADSSRRRGIRRSSEPRSAARGHSTSATEPASGARAHSTSATRAHSTSAVETSSAPAMKAAPAAVLCKCGDGGTSKQNCESGIEKYGEWLRHFKALRNKCVRPADEFTGELAFALHCLDSTPQGLVAPI